MNRILYVLFFSLIVSPLNSFGDAKVTGKIASKSSVEIPGSVTAYHVYTPSLSKSSFLDATGKFSLSLSVGPHVLISRSEDGLKIAFVSVPKGKSKTIKATFKTVKTKAKGAVSAPASLGGIELPKGPTVSVGKIIPVDAQGNQQFRSDGKEITYDSPFITDLFNVSSLCKIEVVEDMDSRAFAAIKAELKLRSSKFIDPKDRVNYSKAIKTLTAWAPMYRIVGTVVSESITSNEIVIKVQIIDTKTGEVFCPKEYATTREALFRGGSTKIVNELARHICGDPLPNSIRGTFSGELIIPPLGNPKESFNGDVTFNLINGDFYKENMPPAGSNTYAVYAGSSVFLRWQIRGGDQCVYTGDASSEMPNPAATVVQLEISPAKLCDERRYTISGTFTTSTPTKINVQCPGDDPFTLDKYYGGSLNSEVASELQSKVSGGKLIGTYTEQNQVWSWDLQEVQ